MADSEIDRGYMEDVQRDLDLLIRMGLVNVDGSGGLVLTEAGEDAIHKVNAQTWN
jgi:Mn-dependent DtxR family transcriptional regulator